MSTKRHPLEPVQTFAQMPAEILPDDARSQLLIRWQRVLRFSIGSDDEAAVDQLPNAELFPRKLPTDSPAALTFLGEVLGVAALKLARPWPEPAGTNFEIDPRGGWIYDLMESSHWRDRVHLKAIGYVVEMALRAPERLPTLIARLDALTNDDLHRMAMDAVQGLPVFPDVFDGLME